MSPPGLRPATQEARGGDTRGGQQTNPNYVRIVNPVENRSPVVKRKEAAHYVSTGRGVWVGSDQLRLVLSHPSNQAKSAAEAEHYDRAVQVLVRSALELKHIPVVCPRIALTDRSVRSGRHVAGRSGPVRIISPAAMKAQ